jgi:predicted transcriptional regulator
MAAARPQLPTELELDVLKVLWRTGWANVRQVRDALAEGGRDLAYTTVMTVLSIMTRKQYLRRKKSGPAFLYYARAIRERTLGQMIQRLVHRAFDGSASAAMLHLLETSDVGPEELRQIQGLLDRKATQIKS